MENKHMASCDESGCTPTSEAETRVGRERAHFAPRTSGRRTDEGVTLSVELPGVTEDGLELTLEGRVLTLRAEPEGLEAPAEMRALAREFSDVEYRRSFELTADLDTQSIDARLSHGLLQLEIPIVRPERRTIALR